MDALTRELVNIVAPLVRDLVSDEVTRVVAKLRADGEGERLYSVRAAAQRLNMGETTLRRHIAEGRLRVTRIPGRVEGAYEQRVRGVDLDAFVRRLAGDADRPVSRQAGSKRSRKGTPNAARLDELVRQRLAASK